MSFFSSIRNLFVEQDSGIFRQIPLDTPYRLYASPMPFGAYDRGNRLLGIYKNAGIEHVLMFLTDEEIAKKARKPLRQMYSDNDITFTQYSIKDFHAPELAMMVDFVREASEKLQLGNAAVHCHAGVGRTGVAICCLTKEIQKMSAKDAIDHVKESLEINMTQEQIRVVEQFTLPGSA